MLKETQVKRMVEELSERLDLLKVSRFERWFQYVFLLFFALSVVFSFFLGAESAICTVFAAVLQGTGYFFCAFPRGMWAVQKLLLRLKTDSAELVPSDFWLLGRKLGYMGCLAGGIALDFLAFGLLVL